MRHHWANGLLLGIVLVGMASAACASELRKFTVGTGVSNDLLGYSAALHGNVGFLGAPKIGRPGEGFLFDLTSGALLHRLTPSVSGGDDYFAFDAALDGQKLLVADPGNPLGTALVPGAVYVFDPTTGSELRRLTPIDSTPGDEFGFGVDIDGNTAVIGARQLGTGPGKAYLVDVATGTQLKMLTPSDPVAGADFGYDVAISGNLAVVGARKNFDVLGLVPGTAYVFDVSTGQQLHRLQPSDSKPGDEFGFAIAADGRKAIIGAPDGGIGMGAAYIFDLVTGTQLFKLTPSDPALMKDFGSSVDIFGNTAIVGASGEGSVLGSAYVFDVLTGAQLAKITPSDLAAGDEFGQTVSLFRNRALVGATDDDDPALSAGAGYVFSVPIRGDFNGDGLLTALDINELTAVVRAGTHDRAFDLNGDSRVDGVDRSVWVNEIKNTFFGDANLDGQFDTGDLILVFQGGEYEDQFTTNSEWETGDWTGDAEFGTSDLILAFQTGAYEQGPRAAVVPEPTGLVALGLLACVLANARRRKQKNG